MIMNATVISIDPRGLLVRDSETGEEVFVNFGNPGLFSPGEAIRITYTGTMTPSIPPQISATAIVRVPQPQPQQTQIRRATILQIRRNTLFVRDQSNFRQVIVNYPYAHHFCVGQRVSVQYDTIVLSNPPEVNATEVTPIC